jgi:hypothetical protein
MVFVLRLYFHYHCFHRFLVNDWIMMCTLVLLLSVAALGQAFLSDMYEIVKFKNGEKVPDASFPQVMQNGLHGFGAARTISLVGISAVKINFLVFFKRLGTQITAYLVFRYIILFVTVACGAANIGVMDYKCVFSFYTYMFRHCNQHGTLKRCFDFQKASISLDVITDALSKSPAVMSLFPYTESLVVSLPVVILWNVRIDIRKKKNSVLYLWTRRTNHRYDHCAGQRICR